MKRKLIQKSNDNVRKKIKKEKILADLDVPVDEVDGLFEDSD
jgi:hypothetical protein